MRYISRAGSQKFWVQPPGFTPRYWGCLGIRHTPAHPSRGYFQTRPSQNPPNVCFKRLNTALNCKRKLKPKHNCFCNVSVAIKTQKVYREFHGQVRLKEELRMQGQAECRPRLRRPEKLMCWAARVPPDLMGAPGDINPSLCPCCLSQGLPSCSTLPFGNVRKQFP